MAFPDIYRDVASAAGRQASRNHFSCIAKRIPKNISMETIVVKKKNLNRSSIQT